MGEIDTFELDGVMAKYKIKDVDKILVAAIHSWEKGQNHEAIAKVYKALTVLRGLDE